MCSTSTPLDYAARLSEYENRGECGGVERADSARTIAAKVRRLAALLREAAQVVVHTGAGISTSAGIPDFRGPKGVWTRQQDSAAASGAGSKSKGTAGEVPPSKKRKHNNSPSADSATASSSGEHAMAEGETGEAVGAAAAAAASEEVQWHEAQPTLTHMVLAALLRAGHVTYIISQNVDGLHSLSGVPRASLSELHGNLFVERCAACGAEFTRGCDLGGVGLRPTGRHCGREGCAGVLHDTVLDWEDELPEPDTARAWYHSECAHGLALCLGTSMQMNPASQMPLATRAARGKVAIVNLQRTCKDGVAALLLRAPLDVVMVRPPHASACPSRAYASHYGFLMVVANMQPVLLR